MKIFGKEISPASISVWMNIVSFIIGICFYFKIEHNTEHQNQVPVLDHSYDSLLIITTKLNTQVRELKQVQEKLITEITKDKTKLSEQTQEVNVHRQHIHSIVNSDWNSLNTSQQNAYINHLMSNLSAGASAKAGLKQNAP